MSNESAARATPSLDPVSPSYDYRKWRENFMLAILRASVVLGVFLIAFSFGGSSAIVRYLYILLYAVVFGVTALPVAYEIRAYVFLGVVFVIGINSVLHWGPWLDGSVFFLAFIALAALLFDNRADVAALVLSAAAFLILAVLQVGGILPLQTDNPIVRGTTLFDWLAYMIDLLVPGTIIVVAVARFKREFDAVVRRLQDAFRQVTEERARLETRVQERTEELEARNAQLRASTIVARGVAEIRDIHELMDAIANLTAAQFGYPHIGLYLLDETKKTAFLQASSSARGKELVGQGFRIEPSRRDPFFAVVEKNLYLVSDSESDAYFRDSNFPQTRSRLILPLTTRGNVLGLLDIHSDKPRAFSPQDAEILQTMADLAAVSIDNARLLNETKNLVSQLEASIASRTRETWSKFASRKTPGYQYTPAGVRPIFSKKTPSREEGEGLNVPLTLHGQKIGLLRLKRKGVFASWSEREKVLVEKIADQVALALENSRLVEEAQRSALRDQLIAATSSRVRETLDIESVVRTAAAELRKVFDVKEAEIVVGFLQSGKSGTSGLKSS